MDSIFTGSVGRQAIAITGTAVQLPGGACKAVMISAKQAIAHLVGGASTDNADTILIGVGAAPSLITAYTGIPLRPGETLTLQVTDLSQVFINGTAADAITYAILY